MNWQLCLSDLLVVLGDAIQLPIFTGGSIISIILSAPKMWSTWLAFRKLELDAVQLYQVSQQIPVMTAAIKQAQSTGDTSALEALFGKPKS
jgi:hypothetical protein